VVCLLLCGCCVCYCVGVEFVIVWVVFGIVWGCVCYCVGVQFVIVWGLWFLLCGGCVCNCVGFAFVIVWELCL